jgi:hypothetical protein
MQPYWRLLLGGVVLVIGAAVAFGILANRRTAAESKAWNQYLSALSQNDFDLERISEVGRKYPGTSAALWAYQRVADAALADGTRLMFENREEAAEKLAEAIESYSFVAENAQDPLLKQQSTFGWAQALEASNKLDEAAAKFESIVQQAPGTTVATLAEKRLKELRDKDTADFYAWFYAQKPASPPSTPATGSSTPSLRDLPGDPDLSIPLRGAEPATGATGPPPPTSVEEIDFGSDNPAVPGPDLNPPQEIPPSDRLPVDLPDDPASAGSDGNPPAVEGPPPATTEPGSESAGQDGPSPEPGAQ